MRTLILSVSFAVASGAGAQGWQALPAPPVIGFVASSPADARLLYAGTSGGLQVSSDGGLSWRLRTRGLPGPGAGCFVQTAAFDPDRPRAIVIGAGNRASSIRGCGAYRSRGRGRRWRSLGIDAEGVSALAVASGRGEVMWAGTTGDGSDVAGSVLKRVTRGDWQVMLQGDDVDLDVTALAVDPRDPDVVYAATNNEGVAKTTDGGMTWSWINVGLPRFDGLGNASPTGAFVLTVPLVLDAGDPHTVHVGTLGFGSCCPDLVGVGGDVFTSHDGGATWTGSTSGLHGVNVLALASDPVRPGTVYAGTTDGVFRSLDGGATWSPFGLQGGPPVWSLAVAHDGSALFAANWLLQRRGL
jgi:hypothetical protein